MRILVINAGSTSLKLALWDTGSGTSLARWKAVGIGERGHQPDHCTALRHFASTHPDQDLEAIGHRIVHGGPHQTPCWLDEPTLEALNALIPLAPLHQPPALALVHAAAELWPGIPQAAVYDTSFHRTLPPMARDYALPASWREQGIRRYGFHGIACQDVVEQLDATRREKLVICHLGGGASATALRRGESVDTSMGLTPLEGLMMTTRSGDVDPGALLYLMQSKGLSPEALAQGLNTESGLLGLASDTEMSRLLARRDPVAQEAVALYAYRVRKTIGAYAAVLEGLDQLVFSGGIGERAAPLRAMICEPLHYLGLRLDPQANAIGATRISAAGSSVDVRVIEVDESRVIARLVAALPR
ncbi:acetate/propionate family kinase [Thermithiobacillus plumbiphilus]|uniref:Acetate kinase n=1 Tax=Thermithiobacillus plumbiphilus TaxID=1729899 RepID=A0ABU9D5Y7_9PROT